MMEKLDIPRNSRLYARMTALSKAGVQWELSEQQSGGWVLSFTPGCCPISMKYSKDGTLTLKAYKVD